MEKSGQQNATCSISLPKILRVLECLLSKLGKSILFVWYLPLKSITWESSSLQIAWSRGWVKGWPKFKKLRFKELRCAFAHYIVTGMRLFGNYSTLFSHNLLAKLIAGRREQLVILNTTKRVKLDMYEFCCCSSFRGALCINACTCI